MLLDTAMGAVLEVITDKGGTKQLRENSRRHRLRARAASIFFQRNRESGGSPQSSTRI